MWILIFLLAIWLVPNLILIFGGVASLFTKNKKKQPVKQAPVYKQPKAKNASKPQTANKKSGGYQTYQQPQQMPVWTQQAPQQTPQQTPQQGSLVDDEYDLYNSLFDNEPFDFNNGIYENPYADDEKGAYELWFEEQMFIEDQLQEMIPDDWYRDPVTDVDTMPPNERIQYGYDPDLVQEQIDRDRREEEYGEYGIYIESNEDEYYQRLNGLMGELEDEDDDWLVDYLTATME